MSPDASTLMIISALLAGGIALGTAGWRMELAGARAEQVGAEPPTEEGDNDVQPQLTA